MTETGMKTIDELRARLRQLDTEIAETRKRLPAHSVKPPIMQEIFELEDQREAILARLKELE